jgi:hypothetical protein
MRMVTPLLVRYRSRLLMMKIPVFENCPSDLTVNNDPDKCGTNVIWSVPVADDNCGIASVTQTEGPAPGSFLSVGTHTIIYVATDVNGNSVTCSFDITVNDMELPEIACPTQFLTQDADEIASGS